MSHFASFCGHRDKSALERKLALPEGNTARGLVGLQPAGFLRHKMPCSPCGPLAEACLMKSLLPDLEDSANFGRQGHRPARPEGEDLAFLDNLSEKQLGETGWTGVHCHPKPCITSWISTPWAAWWKTAGTVWAMSFCSFSHIRRRGSGWDTAFWTRLGRGG